ncbi:MAG: DMT family transporter [Phycisphaerae bacterium]|nr:DMT family transporter [Tepidisphaeraceae bacterium]
MGETRLTDPTLEYETQADARERRRHVLAGVGVLVVCCVLWGYSFPVMQIAAGAFERHMLPERASAELLGVRGVFNGVRFLLAAGVYALVVALGRRLGRARNEPGHSARALPEAPPRMLGARELRAGVVVGTFFGAGMLLQVMGLVWTLPSVSAFLTSLAVVFAPVGQAAILKRRVGVVVWFAVTVAVIGVVMLSWPKGGQEVAQHTLAVRPPVAALGELLTVAAAVLFTAQILAVDHFGRSSAERDNAPLFDAPLAERIPPRPPVNSAGMTLIMLTTTGTLSLITGLAVARTNVWTTTAWRGVLADVTFWWSMGSLVVFCSVMALSLMNRYQPRVSAAVAAVVYCTEPVFGTAFSLAFGAEKLTLLTVLGGMAVLGAVAVVGVGGTSDERS